MLLFCGCDVRRRTKYSLTRLLRPREGTRQRIAHRVGHALEVLGCDRRHDERCKPSRREADHPFTVDRSDLGCECRTIDGHQDGYELIVIGEDDVRESTALEDT